MEALTALVSALGAGVLVGVVRRVLSLATERR